MYKVCRRNPDSGALISCAWKSLPEKWRQEYPVDTWLKVGGLGALVFDTITNASIFADQYRHAWNDMEIWECEVDDVQPVHSITYPEQVSASKLAEIIEYAAKKLLKDVFTAPWGTHGAKRIKLTKLVYEKGKLVH